MAAAGQITQLLQAAEAGREGALDELMDVVYGDLERMAAASLRRQFGERAGSLTLEPAALVNESFMRLIRQRTKYDNRGHFFGIATRVMLRVLIDYRRSRDAAKRGGRKEGRDPHITLALDEQQVAGPAGVDVIEVEDLAAALDRLDRLDARKADIVRMRIVWGLNTTQIAESLGVSPSTVERDWRFARAWLADEVGLTEAEA